MPLFAIIVWVLAAGVVCWLIRRAPFIDEPFKSIGVWIIVACVVLWILSLALREFGMGSGPVIG